MPGSTKVSSTKLGSIAGNLLILSGSPSKISGTEDPMLLLTSSSAGGKSFEETTSSVI
jgi:hypothetical protein